MVPSEVKAEDLLADISSVIDRQGPALTEMRSGPLSGTDEQLTHGIVTRLTNIASAIQLDARKPNPDMLKRARSTARTSLGFVTNHLANHLVDLKEEAASIAKVFGVDETQLVLGATKVVRAPEEVPELVESVREASPVGLLCVDAAKALHKTIAYAEQQLAKSGQSQEWDR